MSHVAIKVPFGSLQHTLRCICTGDYDAFLSLVSPLLHPLYLVVAMGTKPGVGER